MRYGFGVMQTVIGGWSMEWEISGKITPRGDGSYGVELRGKSMSGGAAGRAPRGGSISAPSADDIDAEIERCRSGLDASLVVLGDALVVLMAEENKSGRVSAGRALRQIWLPLVSAAETIPSDALVFGLEAAVKKGAANVNYAKRAASSYVRGDAPGVVVASRYGRLGADDE